MEYRVFKIKDEMETIKHWALLDYAEVGVYADKIEVDPDWDHYLNLDDLGMLLCCGAYDGDTLVGYDISIISTTFHSKTVLFSISDVLWVHPDHRGSTGVRLMKFHEEECKKLGVSVMTMNFTMRNDISSMMGRMGWDHIEKTYAKYIKE